MHGGDADGSRSEQVRPAHDDGMRKGTEVVAAVKSGTMPGPARPRYFLGARRVPQWTEDSLHLDTNTGTRRAKYLSTEANSSGKKLVSGERAVTVVRSCDICATRACAGMKDTRAQCKDVSWARYTAWRDGWNRGGLCENYVLEHDGRAHGWFINWRVKKMDGGAKKAQSVFLAALRVPPLLLSSPSLHVSNWSNSFSVRVVPSTTELLAVERTKAVQAAQLGGCETPAAEEQPESVAPVIDNDTLHDGTSEIIKAEVGAKGCRLLAAPRQQRPSEKKAS